MMQTKKHVSVTATACTESPSRGITPTIPSQGSFQLSSNTIQNILHIPFRHLPLPSSGEFYRFYFHIVHAFKKKKLQ